MKHDFSNRIAKGDTEMEKVSPPPFPFPHQLVFMHSKVTDSLSLLFSSLLLQVVDAAGGLDEIAKDLHALKTEIMMDMVNANMMPPRPGIRRIIGEAAKAGVPMAICSTSNEKAVRAVLNSVLNAGEPLGISIDDIPIFAGDIVPKKKPDPAVYQLAAKELLGNSSSTPSSHSFDIHLLLTSH